MKRSLCCLALLGCIPSTEAEPYDPPRITVEQSGDMTIYTDSLTGVLCYRIGGSLSCLQPNEWVTDTVEVWE